MLTDILAGIVCGLLMGSVFLGVEILLIVSRPGIFERLARGLTRNITATEVMLFLVISVPLLWGILGALAGLLYKLVSDSFPNAGLGSPNFAFTLAVISIAALVTIMLLLLGRGILRLGLMINIAFVAIFGWILPLLANLR